MGSLALSWPCSLLFLSPRLKFNLSYFLSLLTFAGPSMQQLRQLLHDWLTARPKRLELAAARKDFAALLEQAPYICPLRPLWHGCCADLVGQVAQLQTFLQAECAPLLRTRAGMFADVASPFSGGVRTVSHCVPQVQNHNTSRHGSMRPATHNPGRTGFSA